MKIAYLVTAYSDPIQLNRLVNSLDNGENGFFIHVDKKIDINPYLQLIKNPNVSWASERYLVSWGGYNQALSRIRLFEDALASSQKYDMFASMSEMDYPLLSNEEIERYLENNPEKEYIRGLNLTRCHDKKQRGKIEKYWHFDPFSNIRFINHVCNVFLRAFNFIMSVLGIHRPQEVKLRFSNGELHKCDIWFGSEYCILTRKAVEQICTVFKVSHEFHHVLKYTFTPVEICIHTILFNLSLRENAELFEKYNGLAALAPVHYFIYGKEIKVFTIDDYLELKRSGKLFFRKAKTGISDTLLNRIDNERKC